MSVEDARKTGLDGLPMYEGQFTHQDELDAYRTGKAIYDSQRDAENERNMQKDAENFPKNNWNDSTSNEPPNYESIGGLIVIFELLFKAARLVIAGCLIGAPAVLSLIAYALYTKYCSVTEMILVGIAVESAIGAVIGTAVGYRRGKLGYGVLGLIGGAVAGVVGEICFIIAFFAVYIYQEWTLKYK